MAQIATTYDKGGEDKELAKDIQALKNAHNLSEKILELENRTDDPSVSPSSGKSYIWYRADIDKVSVNNNGSIIRIGGAGSGTVTSVSVTTANGVSGSVATSTTTPAITLSLGAITPTSVAASGTVTGSNLSGTHSGTSSGTNTGDESMARKFLFMGA